MPRGNPGVKRNRPARCGTTSGYQRHRRLGEVPCRECTDAHSDYSYDRTHPVADPDKWKDEDK